MHKRLCIGLFMAVFTILCSGNVFAAKNVKVLNMVTYFSNSNDKGFTFETDSKVPVSELKKRIRITPSVGYFSVDSRYSSNEHGKFEVCGKFVGGQKYEFKLLGGLNDSEEYKFNEFKQEFTAKEATSEIEFPTGSNIIELRSKQMVPMKFTNIKNSKVTLTKVPAFFGPVFDGLAIFQAVDENSYQSSALKEPLAGDKNTVSNYAKNFKEDFETNKKAFAALKNVNCPGLSDFLNGDFTENSQTFLGSDNKDETYYFSLPFDFRSEPEKGGAVIADIREVDKENPTSTMRMFQLTDIAITYKFSKRELLGWITSIETGKPMANVPVMLADKTGQFFFFPGKTDSNGLIKVNDETEYSFVKKDKENVTTGSRKLEISELADLAAATPNDSAFIRLDFNRLYAGSIAMAAPDMRALDSIRAYAFTERGIYKPGETVYFKVAMREYKAEAIGIPTDIKAKVTITDPRSEVVYEKELPLTPYGTCSDAFVTKSFMARGYYSIDVSAIQSSKYFGSLGKQDPKWNFLMGRQEKEETDNAKKATEEEKTETKFLTSYSFQVNDFEAPRHFVDMNMNTVTRKVRQIVGRDADQTFMECKVMGKYYAGGVLRHAKVQWSAHLVEKESSNNKYPMFCFGSNDSKKELLESGNSVLDNNGELVVSLPVNKAVLSGLNKIQVTATVLDMDGKPATLVKDYAPIPAVRVGITKVPSNLLRGVELPIQVIALDGNNQLVNSGEVSFEVLRKRYMYIQKRAADGNGGLYYNWESAWVKSYNTTGKIVNSAADFNVAFPEGGEYLLRARYFNGKDEAVCDQKVEIEYSYSSYTDIKNNNRDRSENEIVLTPDKKEVAIGQAVKIRYTLPRVCDYALVTLETGDIVESKVIKLDKAQGEFTMTMTDKCKPNAFVSFVAPSVRSGFPVYSSDSDTDYPRAYFGTVSLKVLNSVDVIKIDVCPSRTGELVAKPGESYKVDFKLTDKNGSPVVAEAAVAVVDESVLALTGFVTPVLNSLTNFVMPLSVFTGDLRVSLINQELFKLVSTRLLTGGGEGVGSVNSDLDARKDFRPVAFWAPELVSAADGTISAEFKLPDTMTSYRIYAVALNKGISFGSNERQLRVVKDFYIEPSVPSFLTAGDKAVVITAAHNKTDKTGTANVSVAVSDGVSASVQNGAAALNGFSTGVTKVAVNADKGARAAKLTVQGAFNGNSDAVENSIDVKSASILFSRYASGFFTENSSVKAEVPAYINSLSEAEKAGTVKAHISVAATPWTRLVPAVSYLMNYPHGCVEQTSSRIIGLAAIRNMAKEGVFSEFNLAEVDAYLKAGLEHLLKMQLSNGGFSYWTSSPSECEWGSQYAVFALSVLKKSGYEFDQKYLENALRYMRAKLFNESTATTFKEPLNALGAVSLAMNQKINEADFKVLKNKFAEGMKSLNAKVNPSKDIMTRETETLIQYAECFCGSRSLDELGYELRSTKPLTLESRGWRYSSVRRDAFVLLANATVHGDKKVSDDFAGSLFKKLTDRGYWTSTADTGVALCALAEYFKGNKPVEDKDFVVKVTTKNGTKELKVGKTVPATVELSADELCSEIKLVAETKATVNYNLSYTYPDQPNRQEAVDNGFILDKTIENLNGTKEIRVGDVVKVTFYLETTPKAEKADLSYMVVEDPIPAGFTAINTSLKNDALPASVAAEDEEAYCDYSDGAYTFYASHKELRKDAMVAYKDYCWNGRYKLVYYVRATCEGTFVMKSPMVSLMYNPEIYGIGKTSTVEVLPAK